jgi:hypothetical protein
LDETKRCVRRKNASQETSVPHVSAMSARASVALSKPCTCIRRKAAMFADQTDFITR